MSEQPIILEGEQQTRIGTLITLAHALAIEIKMPGFRVSHAGTAYDAAKIQNVIPRDDSKGTKNNKKKALIKTIEAIKAAGYESYEPSRSITIALNS